jgi:basic membrane protein A and related proteins
MKKRVLVLVLLAMVMVGASQQASAADKPIRVAVVLASTVNDMAWGQSMYTALVAIQKSMGGESALQIKVSENMGKLPDANAAIRDYATQGYDIIFAHGSQYAASAAEIAKDFPKVTFAWGTATNTYGLPNVYAYTSAAEEGGYVQGLMAAKLSKSKILGITGPVEVGDSKQYADGFVQGARSVDPAIKVNKTWTGSFSDVALMTEAAKTHISAGADGLTATSQSAVGTVGAAKAAGKVVYFGMQADQTSLAPDNVVSSQVYDWIDMLKQMIAGRKANKLGGVTYVGHLNNGGIKIVFNPQYKLSGDVKKAADAAIEGIKKGTIKVNP